MFKNISPRVIAILTATMTTLVVAIFFFLVEDMDILQGKWALVIAALAGIYVLVYAIITYMLERYIYRRVKLIYKIIHDSKTSVQNPAEIRSDSNILATVQNDVARWAKTHEEEIAALKNLEAYRKNFIGNVSHELKTPIFSAQGYIHTLIDGAIDDEEVNMKYLMKAANNIERLTTVVDDLEAISRLEQGRVALDIQPFDIKVLALEVIEDAELLADEKDISISLKDGAKKSTIVHADRENIRQVLNNLITNAIKYGIEGGMVKVGFYDMDKYVLIEVTDNGIGVSEKHLNHLFDRFYRVDKSRSRKIGGSGLGLAIVKHIIEAHKQTINVRSTKGEGSTFGFTLEKG